MSDYDTLIKNIGYLAKIGENEAELNKTSVVGTVKSIESETNPDGTSTFQYAIVTPADTTLNDIPYVRLSADDSSLPLMVPAVGSVVFLTQLDDSSGIITHAGLVSKMNLAVSPNGHNYGGLPKISELTDKLNNLENTVNDLRTMILNLQNVYNSHTHEVGAFYTPSTSLTPIYTDTAPSALTLTQISDYENPVVVHGDSSPAISSWFTQIDLLRIEIEQQQIIVLDDLDAMGGTVNNNSPSYQKYLQDKAILDSKILQYNNLLQAPPQS